MKNKLIIFLAMLPFSVLFAQTNSNNIIPCISHEIMMQQLKENPELIFEQLKLEEETKAYEQNLNSSRSASVPRIIPVVFHIIHEYGSENISKEQILSQMDGLNEDFNRLNSDTGNTPNPFKVLSGGANIEFRLATLDPNGNCTDGINRLYSPLTNNARDNVKSLIYWPRNRYLNVWVVRTIENSDGGSGTVLGFAQFPGFGSAQTDGVVMRSDYTGRIGTSNSGRTLTHEVGHWLNLRHIWGDATCGDDAVSDTPQHEGPNYGCPQFPHLSPACSQNANGDMFTNYMDYSNSSCMNQFSIGQCTRMNAALNSSSGQRNNLATSSNLAATGTTNLVTPNCAPVADFTPFLPTFICAGQSVAFTDFSYRSTPTTYNWTFTGGTPATSSAENPTIVYNTPGTYNVSLTVSNANGTHTFSRQALIIVSPNEASVQDTLTQGFEDANVLNGDWTVINRTTGSPGFIRTNAAKFGGDFSMYLNNFNESLLGSVDELVSPSYNFSNIDSIYVSYRYAYVQKANSATNQNRLQVFVSEDCGKSWLLRSNVAGNNLATQSTNVNTSFTPTAQGQWRLTNIPSVTAYANKPNVRFKFVFTSGGDGNNFYLDNVNVGGRGVFSNLPEKPSVNYFNIYPNPNNGNFTLENIGGIIKEVVIYDLLGKEVYRNNSPEINNNQMSIDLNNKVSNGLYMVNVRFEDKMVTQKVAVRF